MKVCVVIPHFDHVDSLRAMLPKLVALRLPLIIVDDDSPDDGAVLLARAMETIAPDAILVRHARNLGKGGAVQTGLRAAWRAGYTHAVQIDADGQHDVHAISVLCETAAADHHVLVCGEPAFDNSISGLRYYARYITLYLIWAETLSTRIRDGLCGLRLYPLRSVIELLDESRLPSGMAFDPEILVRAFWAGIPLRFIRVRVCYPEGGKSHFRYVGDNLEIAWMHTRLLFGMLIRLPRLAYPSRRRQGRSHTS